MAGVKFTPAQRRKQKLKLMLNPETGYPLKRLGDSEPVDIDLKTGKPIKKVN